MYSETTFWHCSWSHLTLIKAFLRDSFMPFSSSHSSFLVFNSVIQDSFQHFSMTFDLAWDFILWADSYTEQCFYYHWHIEEVLPLDFNQMGVLGRIGDAAGPSTLRWSFYPGIFPVGGGVDTRKQVKKIRWVVREGGNTKINEYLKSLKDPKQTPCRGPWLWNEQ